MKKGHKKTPNNRVPKLYFSEAEGNLLVKGIEHVLTTMKGADDAARNWNELGRKTIGEIEINSRSLKRKLDSNRTNLFNEDELRAISLAIANLITYPSDPAELLISQNMKRKFESVTGAVINPLAYEDGDEDEFLQQNK